MYSEWYEPAQPLQYDEWISSKDLDNRLTQRRQSSQKNIWHKSPHEQDFEEYEPPQPLQYSEYYPPQQYQEDFEGYPPQQYQEDFEWYAPPPYQQDFEGYPPPHDQQDPYWYHPPQVSQPPVSTMDTMNMIQQLLDAQNACLQDLKTHEFFTLAENADVNADNNILDEEDCLIEDEAEYHPVTEDSDVQVGGDDSITNEGDEETSLTPATTPTAELDESPQLVKTQVTPTPKPKLTTSPQLEVTPVMPLSSAISATPRNVIKSSTSPPHKESDYIRKAPMYEEVIDGESLEYLFFYDETSSSFPEKLCKVPALDPEPDKLQKPFECVNGEMEIVDEPVAENGETAHLSLMKIENSVPINASMLEEKLTSFATSGCLSQGKDLTIKLHMHMIKLHQNEVLKNNSTGELDQNKIKMYLAESKIHLSTTPFVTPPVDFNIKCVKNCSNMGEKLAGAFTPRYEDMTYYLVVENMANKLDQHMKKQFFEDANYSFWDEPNLCKRGFDDAFGSLLHTKTKRCKGILDSYMPTQKPNVYDEESKPCSPKVKMKPFLIDVSKWVSPGNDEPKGGKDPPWKRQKVEMHLVTETERTPPPLPAPPF